METLQRRKRREEETDWRRGDTSETEELTERKGRATEVVFGPAQQSC